MTGAYGFHWSVRKTDLKNYKITGGNEHEGLKRN